MKGKRRKKKREGGKEETVRELEVPVWVLSGAVPRPSERQ